ncbi:ATP-binding response regulator [Salinarimonas soli]|uniref:histidine kinase n=1 Tax=Salinarimonas soli TaxID=1638099 RepID=A0A5B2VE09_9HYPH|nr:hybrid sensor histidine kinase/response regulator [Salinarimonas soli]KAA2236670.1 hybrid sensor histidine kinase/response regulator [Salinarimonas soli]
MLLSITAAGAVYLFDRPTRVLVADDDPIMREFAIAQLAHPGGTIVTAADGEEAWAILEREPAFDLVLSDLEMPVLNGFGLVERIRTSERHAHLPVVVITSRDDMFAIDRAYEVGATSFAVKPVNWRLLAYQLRYVLRGSRMEGDVRAARDEAERARDLRTTLLTLLQHETRTPLNGIVGYCEILRATASGGSIAGSSLADCVEQIVTSAKGLNEVLRRVFYFARLSAEPLRIDAETVRASHVADEVVRVWQAAARRAGVALRLAESPDDALLAADVGQISTALGELIANALAHALGSAVELAVLRRGDEAGIEVRDHGPGIDPARLRRCLEPFGQGMDPLTRASEGLGLGLPMVKRIAELHGGTLEIDSSGEGTVARLLLPTALAARAYGT